MPTSLITIPQLIAPVYNPIYTKVSSDKTGEEAFNFIFDLYINGNFVNRDRLLPRPASIEAIYSPARILESYLSYDLSQSIVGTSASTECIDYYEVICGEEYINPWRFNDFTAVGTGSTLSGRTVFYTTGSTANPYVSGDTIYVVQDSGYTTNYYNGLFTVLSASSTSVIVDAYYSISTPVTAGLIYYSDRRKTIYTGSTNVLTNGILLFGNGGWSSFGPDGCSVQAGLVSGNKLQLSVPDASCGSGSQTITNTAILAPGASYEVTFTVNNVNNPSGEYQAATPVLGGTYGTPFVGTGTSIQTIVCGTGTTFGMNLNMANADTSGFGTHSMSVNMVSVNNINGFSGYSWNAVYQYEQIPTYTFERWDMGPNGNARFLTNRPSYVNTSLDDRGSIGFMTVLTSTTANYYMISYSTRYDGSPTIPLVYPLAQISSGATLTTNSIICEFGCYPWNLNQLSQSIYAADAVTSDDKEYFIQIAIEPDPIGDPGNLVGISERRFFNLDVPCSKFEPVRFMFLNSLGQFDYFSATLKSQETINITRTQFQKSLSYDYQVGDRGKTLISLECQQTYTAISDWINESTSTWLTELFLSTEVYIINSDGSLMPIIIDNNSVELFKSVNKKMFNYTFNYTKAVLKNTQRG